MIVKNTKNYYAHTKENKPKEEWQLLKTHLINTAELAKGFAKDFGYSNLTEIAKIAGLFHDLGKGTDSFQEYLCGGDIHPNHSGAGAAFLKEKYKGGYGLLFAYLIAGHHRGLYNSKDLLARLKDAQDSELKEIKDFRYTDLENRIDFKVPKIERKEEIHMLIRMLFSCLVDADCLDTEHFIAPETYALRTKFDSIKTIADKFKEKLDNKEKTSSKTTVNTIRADIRKYCKEASERTSGIFTLTVPTGGGKTFSGFEFALDYCLKHNKKRIIYVIPYTSIIEQTANNIGKFIGENNIIEHHSNIDPDKETKISRLASENWDAPVIITTTVQFFESLYAYKPSKCRKLHNIANSVVILDEVQLLPSELKDACFDAIRLLAEKYNTTFLFSTATQPYLTDDLKKMCEEIIPEDSNLGPRLKRVTYDLPIKEINNHIQGYESFKDIAKELKEYKQVLCVVNTKKDALELHGLIPGSIHLSTSMCAEHRTKVIDDIKKKLEKNENICVISTQLIEAGVDIDFPVVYRAFTGLDSIIQSAGRCNREGMLKTGTVKVFISPTKYPKGVGILAREYDAAAETLTPNCDITSQETILSYSKKLYKDIKQNDNYKEYLINHADTMNMKFEDAGKDIKLIKDNTAPIIVRYGKGEKLLEKLRYQIDNNILYWDTLRKLQRFMVPIYKDKINKYIEDGFIEKINDEGIYIWNGLYREDIGIDVNGNYNFIV